MISVIIPCYNRRSTICTSIDSVLEQKTSRHLEIIVSDDGSNDGTVDLLQNRYHERIVLVKSIKEDEHSASAARNRGLDKASGDYICFLDSDDYYLPEFVEEMASQLDKNREVGYVFCRCLKKDVSTGKLSNWTKARLGYLDRSYHVAYSANCINTISIMVRRSVQDAVGRFDTSLKTGEDSDMWIRFSEVSKGLFIDKPLSVYCYRTDIDRLVVNEGSEKIKNGRSVYYRSLLRCNISDDQDIIRKIINTRNLITLSITDKKGFLYSLGRRIYVALCTIVLFPKSCFTFYYKKLLK